MLNFWHKRTKYKNFYAWRHLAQKMKIFFSRHWVDSESWNYSHLTHYRETDRNVLIFFEIFSRKIFQKKITISSFFCVSTLIIIAKFCLRNSNLCFLFLVSLICLEVIFREKNQVLKILEKIFERLEFI